MNGFVFDLQLFTKVKTVKLTNKADEYTNKTQNVKIFALGGNDSIDNFNASHVTIDGGLGDDYISNDESNEVKIYGNAGNDSIVNGDSYTPGKLRYGGDKVKIYGGTGDDSIENLGKNSKVYGDAGNDEIYNSGDYVTVNSGKGDDTVNNQSDHTIVNSGAGNDFIITSSNNYSMTYNSTLSGGKGNDYIYDHNGHNYVLNGGLGNDEIFVEGSNNVTMNGGSGNDSLKYNYSVGTSINGYSGNDYIIGYYSSNSTVSGGTGNDTIEFASYAENNLIQYTSGDGNDVIYGFNSDDTLQVTKGNYKVSTKNNDVIVKVGKGKIILKDAKDQRISIKNSKGKVTTKTYGSSSSDLLAENNFVMADNLSEIVKNNLSPTSLEKIKTNNFENLMAENNLITFSEK